MTVAYAICAASDIPNRRGRGFELVRVVDGAEKPWPIFVVRWDKQVFAYVNRCPHNNVNLDWETNQFFEPGTKNIVCGKHGSLFELASGRCIDGPCLGKDLEPVPVCVLDGDICVVGVELAELPDDDESEPARGAPASP